MSPHGTRLLLSVDGGAQLSRQVATLAGRAGWRTLVAGDGETAIATLGTRDGMMLDAVLVEGAGDDAVALIAELRARRPRLPIVLLTAEGTAQAAVAAMRGGATDLVVKPAAPERVLAALEQAATGGEDGALQPLSARLAVPLGFEDIVGSAPQFRAALAVAAKAARARLPLLMEGEPGVGKAVLAEAVHAASPRARRPFVTVACGAVAANMIESELFGHVAGAFPGAFTRVVGKLVEADGGTVFIDEASRLPAGAQARLLRFLQTGASQAVGAAGSTPLDVRVLAASDTPLVDEVAASRFREDLYFRLAAVHVTIPPLRERRGDVPALAAHLLARIGRQPGLRALGLTEEALALLARYRWPGNVRQLHDVLFRAAVLSEGDVLAAADFPQLAAAAGEAASPPPVAPGAGGVALWEPDGNLRPLEAIEADVIRLAIGHYRGRMTEVARRLGIGRSTLYRRLGELGISDAA